MRYLAIDYGEKRTGLASGDDVLRIAGPLDVFTGSDDDQLLDYLRVVLDEHEVDAFVLGLPLNMDGSESRLSRRVKRLGLRLEAVFGLPVHLVDERLTTAAADERMAGSALTRGQKKSRRDALAAAEILNDFFRLMRER